MHEFSHLHENWVSCSQFTRERKCVNYMHVFVFTKILMGFWDFCFLGVYNDFFYEENKVFNVAWFHLSLVSFYLFLHAQTNHL